MALFKYNGEWLQERRGGLIGSILNLVVARTEQGSRVGRRGRRFPRNFFKPRFFNWLLLLLALLFLFVFATFVLKLLSNGNEEEKHLPLSKEVHEQISSYDANPTPPKSKRRKQHFPCEVGLAAAVDNILEPKNYMNFTQFSLDYVEMEVNPLHANLHQSRFGGHQTLEEREKSFFARNQTIHCGFVKGMPRLSSPGFELSEDDKAYMNTCRVAVSSCIFGSSDFLRRPTSRMISDFSKKSVCFVMFVDEQTLSKLSSEGHTPDEKGYVGLWKIVVVKNLPYLDMRKTGKVPKFLAHRLFPSSWYSIWLDSKMRLNTDPMLIIEFFLWRMRAEFAISNHYDRHCVWEEVLQNKRLNKYNHTAIDEQFMFYQSDGLRKFDPSDPNTPLPSYVPEGSFIIRAHTPMSNLFSCLWFNETIPSKYVQGLSTQSTSKTLQASVVVISSTSLTNQINASFLGAQNPDYEAILAGSKCGPDRTGFIGYVHELHSVRDTPWSLLFMSTIWQLWKARNDSVFNDVCFDVTLLCRRSEIWARYYADGCSFTASLQPVSLSTLCWQRLAEGWICLNSDGAISSLTGIGSVGGLFHIDNGSWLSGFNKTIGFADPFQIELWGILLGLRLAWDNGFKKVLVQSDNQEAAKRLNEAKSDSDLCTLVRAIFRLRNRS
ncbi:hypothetical protein V6N12_019191 [Hibiscus sabdariffa]|uniref:RNase H type-1 domain-containing protein n=1 Tax=Hibiscus sabdariffa TaxID=183260 RepID=A0ABR1ZY70_9ROSI